MTVNTQMDTVPSNWVPNEASELERTTARVPHIPAIPCTDIAPTTSSIFSLSSSGTENTIITPPIAPIIVASPNEGIRGSAVMDTRPANAPFNTIVRSIFLYIICVRISAARAPPAAAVLVLVKILETSAASPIVPKAS